MSKTNEMKNNTDKVEFHSVAEWEKANQIEVPIIEVPISEKQVIEETITTADMLATHLASISLDSILNK